MAHPMQGAETESLRGEMDAAYASKMRRLLPA